MRVVSGVAGGIPLQIPKTDLRPSMELVRGAIFDSLGPAVAGLRVLDLFSGTGAIGIEALSRGAARAVLVELDKRAVACIRINLEKTKLGAHAEVHAMDVFRYIDKIAPAGGFDLIVADPPYAKGADVRNFAPELLRSENLRRALAPDGLFILEHLPGEKLALGKTWVCTKSRRYGATEVAYLTLAQPAATVVPEA